MALKKFSNKMSQDSGASNYRPYSLTCVRRKVIKHVIVEEMNEDFAHSSRVTGQIYSLFTGILFQ